MAQVTVIHEEEVQLRKYIHKMASGENCGIFSCLMTDVGGLTSLYIVSSLPVQVVLGYIRKQIKQATRKTQII